VRVVRFAPLDAPALAAARRLAQVGR
jgi:hypothetical protein